MIKSIDPRTKIIVVLCISTLGVLINNITYLVGILLISMIVTKIFKGSIFVAIKKVRKILYILIGIIILQSIFIKEGNVLIGVESFKIITDVGLFKGIEFFLRIFIVILSGSILATSNIREMIQGLIQWKLPYDISFMVSIGIRFMPILLEEMRDAITAINLRGIDTKKMRLKEKINLYTYVLTPVVVGILTKAQKISISIESRGFRAYDSRTSVLTLKLSKIDYLIMAASISLSGYVLYSFIA